MTYFERMKRFFTKEEQRKEAPGRRAPKILTREEEDKLLNMSKKWVDEFEGKSDNKEEDPNQNKVIFNDWNRIKWLKIDNGMGAIVKNSLGVFVDNREANLKDRERAGNRNKIYA